MIRILLSLFTFGLFSLVVTAQHPFKFDNTVYKAVYLNEAFRLMDSSKKYLLLDVRSSGEYHDTSSHTALNIGRIKGAVNINIDDVPAHLDELKKHINEPVFIYCSHSQRSRRVSKLLAENGFEKIYNINGGMSLVNESDASTFPYKKKVLVTNTAYTNVGATEAIHLITNTADLVIIDLRTENEFASADSLKRNNIGRLKKAVNIPQNAFAEKFDGYKIPNNKPVLLYDLNGHNSMDVVDMLRARGFGRIYNLFGGLTAFSTNHALDKNLRRRFLTETPSYQMLDTKGAIDLVKQNRRLVIFDTRSIEEFENRSATTYLNLGRIKGSIHISSLHALDTLIQFKNKSTQFLVYGSTGDLGVNVCESLVEKGFKNVRLLAQGFYRFVWSTRNVEECKDGQAMLTNHEGLY
jgi:rhodanese-related sulfurtransferase